MNLQITKLEGESNIEYIYRVCSMKDAHNLTWTQIRDIVNAELGYEYSESWYRKGYKNNSFPISANDTSEIRYSEVEDPKINELRDTLFELKKERIKNSDERNQIMAATRKIAREETLLEIAKEVAETLKTKPVLPNYEYIVNTGNKSAILEISDWHYGIEINNPWNKYDLDIAKDRIIKLRSRVVEKLRDNNVKTLYIANLGDLISGRIHETIRIQNRIDVITQCLEVAEILVEFITYLSQYANIKYISTSDNHSRVEPKKELSLDLESLTRIIEPLVEARIKNIQYENKKCKNVEFLKSPFGPDIATFNIGNYKIGAVHGHKDSPKLVVNNVSLMTQANYDLILTAHLHHFSADESYNTVVISNGSLMGVDDYAESLRLMNKPSQNFIVVSEESVVESIHRIVLD
ncbi:MAG: hypothetical protein J6R47_05415 [Acholeplasmatales bacterium]|nr:hypothetical protein [Acholeplasmatales bacterium]